MSDFTWSIETCQGLVYMTFPQHEPEWRVLDKAEELATKTQSSTKVLKIECVAEVMPLSPEEQRRRLDTGFRTYEPPFEAEEVNNG